MRLSYELTCCRYHCHAGSNLGRWTLNARAETPHSRADPAETAEEGTFIIIIPTSTSAYAFSPASVYTMAPTSFRSIYGRHRSSLLARTQKKTFLGLQRPPAPKPQMMGYLVAQGLAIVLLADLAIATVQNEPTTVRAVFQTAGLWKDPPPFEIVHHDGEKEGLE